MSAVIEVSPIALAILPGVLPVLWCRRGRGRGAFPCRECAHRPIWIRDGTRRFLI